MKRFRIEAVTWPAQGKGHPSATKLIVGGTTSVSSWHAAGTEAGPPGIEALPATSQPTLRDLHLLIAIPTFRLGFRAAKTSRLENLS